MTGKFSIVRRKRRAVFKSTENNDCNSKKVIYNFLKDPSSLMSKKKQINSNEIHASWQILGGKLFVSPNQQDINWKPSLQVIFKVCFYFHK